MAIKNLVFDEGLVEFTINGDASRVVSFNPADQNIITRLNDFYKELEKRKAEFKEFESVPTDVGEDGFVKEVSPIAEFQKEQDDFFKKQIDYIFNGNISEIAFGNNCCFSMNSKGEMIAEAFINSASPFVIKEIKNRQNRQKLNAKKVHNYTGQFKK